MRIRTSPGLLILALCQFIGLAWSAGPQLTSLTPVGGQRGTSFVVTVAGKHEKTDKWWCSARGVTFTSTEKVTEWKVDIAPDAPLGPCLLILHNSEGATAPKWFSIGSLPEAAETEPNDSLSEAQTLEKLPVILNGALNRTNDVDGFQVLLKQGQTLSAAVDAYALGSMVDVIAHVVNPAGQRVLTASDGRNLDPQFHYTATEDGWHTVQLAGFPHPPTANIAFTGSSAIVYRLHLSYEPVTTHAYPAVASLTKEQAVQLRGTSLPKEPAHVINQASVRSSGSLLLTELPHAFFPVQTVARSDSTTLALETEPNNDRKKATPIQRGLIAGVLQTKGDEDRFVITLKKGDKLGARVWAKTLGSAADLHLQIEDPTGKIITSNDDFQDQPDPEVQWTAAADGDHQVRVKSLMDEHGETCHYVLAIEDAKPRFTATLSGNPSVVLEAGKTAEFKVTIKRLHSHKAPLVLRAADLPPSVTADEVDVPEKAGEVTLKLKAAEDAASTSAPIRLQVTSKENPSETQSVEADLRGENRRGTSLLDTTDLIWLTLKGKAPTNDTKSK